MTSFPLHFEDLEVGMQLVSGGRTITEGDILQFAMFSGDWNPIHVDAEVARGTVFGQRVLHGVASLSIMGGLVFAAGWFASTVEALLGFDQLRFSTPVFAGDTLRCRFTVAELRVTGSGRGLVTRRLELLNQRDEIVLETLSPILIARKATDV